MRQEAFAIAAGVVFMILQGCLLLILAERQAARRRETVGWYRNALRAEVARMLASGHASAAAALGRVLE